MLPPDVIARDFAPDLPLAEQQLVAVEQGSTAVIALDGKPAKAGWKREPSRYGRAANDRMISPAAEEQMAKRIDAELTSLLEPCRDAGEAARGRIRDIASGIQMKAKPAIDAEKLRERRIGRLTTPSDLDANAAKEVGGAMNRILADVFALYLKTKNFHWHMSGPHFRDYHLLLDEQADQLFAMTDVIAERVRKIGAPTLKSIGQISKNQRVLDNDADYVEPSDMLAELREDNATLAANMREAHEICDKHRDVATASLVEVWIDETERRAWFLHASLARPDSGGR